MRRNFKLADPRSLQGDHKLSLFLYSSALSHKKKRSRCISLIDTALTALICCVRAVRLFAASCGSEASSCVRPFGNLERFSPLCEAAPFFDVVFVVVTPIVIRELLR